MANRSATPSPNSIAPWRQNFANDIIDKQYRIYSWYDGKTSSLITTNSILLAAIGFLFKECLTDVLSLTSIILSFTFIGISLFYSLRQVIPQGSSGKTVGLPNIRSMTGISSFENWEDYHNRLKEIDQKFLFEVSARTIYGMTCNSCDSRKTILKGIYLTMVGIVFILLTFASVTLASIDIHILGRLDSKSSLKNEHELIKQIDTDLKNINSTLQNLRNTQINTDSSSTQQTVKKK